MESIKGINKIKSKLVAGALAAIIKEKNSVENTGSGSWSNKPSN